MYFEDVIAEVLVRKGIELTDEQVCSISRTLASAILAQRPSILMTPAAMLKDLKELDKA